MNYLIKVTEKDGKVAVSAKELYNFLEIKTEFSHWCKRMFEYGFEENVDYSPFLTESTGGRPSTDYVLSIDCAKEISMIQRSEKGKQARKYFIECEKKLKENTKPMSMAEIVAHSANMLVEVEKKQLELEHRMNVIEAKQTTSSCDYFTIAGYCALKGFKVSFSDASKYGKDASKICSQRGISMGKVQDPRFGTVKTYPDHVLEEVVHF